MSAGQILGYVDRWSVLPGETVVCRVSCEACDSFDAELVRIIQGDTHPDGPGYREEPTSVALGGPFPARYQPIETGSFALVEDAAPFSALASFALVAALWPTTPGRGAQTIVARRDPKSGQGFELFVDDSGAIAAEVAVLAPIYGSSMRTRTYWAGSSIWERDTTSSRMKICTAMALLVLPTIVCLSRAAIPSITRGRCATRSTPSVNTAGG